MKTANHFPEVGQPDTTPMPGYILWEHPRVQDAEKELESAAVAYSEEIKKDVRARGFIPLMDASNRLLNAAIAFANTVKEYRDT